MKMKMKMVEKEQGRKAEEGTCVEEEMEEEEKGKEAEKGRCVEEE